LFGACATARSPLEAIGSEFGLTRQRIQQIAKHVGINWENRRRAILGAGIKQPQNEGREERLMAASNQIFLVMDADTPVAAFTAPPLRHDGADHV
jgi:hypothetical protein